MSHIANFLFARTNAFKVCSNVYSCEFVREQRGPLRFDRPTERRGGVKLTLCVTIFPYVLIFRTSQLCYVTLRLVKHQSKLQLNAQLLLNFLINSFNGALSSRYPDPVERAAALPGRSTRESAEPGG